MKNMTTHKTRPLFVNRGTGLWWEKLERLCLEGLIYWYEERWRPRPTALRILGALQRDLQKDAGKCISLRCVHACFVCICQVRGHCGARVEETGFLFWRTRRNFAEVGPIRRPLPTAHALLQRRDSQPCRRGRYASFGRKASEVYGRLASSHTTTHTMWYDGRFTKNRTIVELRDHHMGQHVDSLAGAAGLPKDKEESPRSLCLDRAMELCLLRWHGVAGGHDRKSTSCHACART